PVDPQAVVMDPRCLAMHDPIGPHDPGAQGVPDALMTQADSQERDPRSEPRDHLAGDPRSQRSARASRADPPARPDGRHAAQPDLAVAEDSEVQARIDLAVPLDEIVRERIVIIDQEDHASLVQSLWSLGRFAG